MIEAEAIRTHVGIGAASSRGRYGCAERGSSRRRFPAAVTEIDESLLPPRPDLSRYMMTAGFMLSPTRFLESCQERYGDYFTLRPARTACS